MDGTHTVSTTNNLIVREGPPADDCCPICFGSFSVPCRGPCGHWYCGGCIMEYWNHVAAFHPCKCPMCSRPISKLTPESTLSQQQDPGIHEVLKNVKQYNCLFAGGACGFILQVLQLPLFVKRLLQAMMDPDRPVAYLSRLRLVAVFLGAMYTLSPFDFLPRWRYLDAIDLFDYSAIALSFSLYFVGLYTRRRRLRHLRQLAPVPHFESADVWSCGVALYVMLVGAYPFEDQEDPKNFRKTIQRIMAVQYKIPDYVHISQDCRHLLSRIFVANASRRISLKEIKSHPWFLKNLPRELTETAQAAYYRKENPTFSPQSVEEIMKIVEDAKTPPTASRSIGGFGWGQEDDDDEDEYDKRVKEAHQSGEVCLT